MFYEGQRIQYSNNQTDGRTITARIEGVTSNVHGYILFLDNGDYCYEDEVVR